MRRSLGSPLFHFVPISHMPFPFTPLTYSLSCALTALPVSWLVIARHAWFQGAFPKETRPPNSPHHTTGSHEPRQYMIGKDRDAQNGRREYRTGQDWTEHDRTGHDGDRTGLDRRGGQDRTGHDTTRQDSTDRTGHPRTEQDASGWTVQYRTGQVRTGHVRPGQNATITVAAQATDRLFIF